MVEFFMQGPWHLYLLYLITSSCGGLGTMATSPPGKQRERWTVFVVAMIALHFSYVAWSHEFFFLAGYLAFRFLNFPFTILDQLADELLQSLKSGQVAEKADPTTV